MDLKPGIQTTTPVFKPLVRLFLPEPTDEFDAITRGFASSRVHNNDFNVPLRLRLDSRSGVSDSLPPPQSDDLNAPQISVIRATPYNSCYEENAHAHKTKRGEEKGDSDAQIKVGRQESSKKEPESRR
jgi:hypothetical protein